LATRTLSIPLFVGGGSTLTGPTVDVGDTITVTVTVAGSSGTAASNNASGCTVVSNVTIGTATANAVTNFSGSTYSFQFTHTDTNTTVYFRNVTGTINASITAPVVNNSQTFATTASSSTSCVISLSSSGSGGTLQYNKSTSTTVPTSGWQSSSTVTGLTRGTAYYFWARRGVGSEDRTDSAITVPYLAPDLSISLGEGSFFTIGASDTSFVLTVQNGNSNDRYQVRDSSGTQHESRLGNGTITVTDTPSGGSESYTIFGKRPTATGGTDIYATTGTSVTVSQQSASGIVPPVIQSVTNDNPNSSNVTATVNLTNPGSGGTLQYAQTTSNSVPSSGWQSGNTFSHPRNTTRYYWASQSTNTAGAYDSQSHFVGSYSTEVYGFQIFNASGTLTLDSLDRVSGIVSRGSFNVTTGTTNVGGQIPQYEGTSTSIAFQGMDPNNEEEFEVWISGDIPTAQFGLTNFTINRGTNSYTVTYRSYTASQTISVPYFNVRY